MDINDAIKTENDLNHEKAHALLRMLKWGAYGLIGIFVSISILLMALIKHDDSLGYWQLYVPLIIIGGITCLWFAKAAHVEYHKAKKTLEDHRKTVNPIDATGVNEAKAKKHLRGLRIGVSLAFISGAILVCVLFFAKDSEKNPKWASVLFPGLLTAVFCLSTYLDYRGYRAATQSAHS